MQLQSANSTNTEIEAQLQFVNIPIARKKNNIHFITVGFNRNVVTHAENPVRLFIVQTKRIQSWI